MPAPVLTMDVILKCLFERFSERYFTAEDVIEEIGAYCTDRQYQDIETKRRCVRSFIHRLKGRSLIEVTGKVPGQARTFLYRLSPLAEQHKEVFKQYKEITARKAEAQKAGILVYNFATYDGALKVAKDERENIKGIAHYNYNKGPAKVLAAYLEVPVHNLESHKYRIVGRWAVPKEEIKCLKK